MKESLINLLRKQGFRITPLLKSIIDIFCQSDVHLSVLDLIAKLEKAAILPNKTTLYRQLERLTRMGILQENMFPDTFKRYCIQYQHHHHHFICDECGSIKSIAIDSCKSMTEELTNQLRKKGYAPKQHIIDFIGTCQHCLIT